MEQFLDWYAGDYVSDHTSSLDICGPSSIELYRVANGELSEEWISPDMTTLMRQLTDNG
jgi:hypothetical protein